MHQSISSNKFRTTRDNVRVYHFFRQQESRIKHVEMCKDTRRSKYADSPIIKKSDGLALGSLLTTECLITLVAHPPPPSKSPCLLPRRHCRQDKFAWKKRDRNGEECKTRCSARGKIIPGILTLFPEEMSEGKK